MPGLMGTNSWSRQIDHGQRIIEMQKSMAVEQLGTLGVSPGPGQIGVQSLESQLYILTYGDSEFKLMQDIESIPVYNWVHEYNVLQNYGSAVGAAVGAAALPPVNNSYLKRGYANVKFYLDLRSIPQQLLEIESAVGDWTGVETRNSMLTLLGKIEHDLFWGDSSLNQFAFDGALAQINASGLTQNVIDLRGGVLDPGTLEKAALVVRQNWGDAGLNTLYCPPAVMTPFVTNYIQTQRTVPSLWEGGAGNPFSYWDAQYGRINIRDDRFTERDPFNGSYPITALTTVPQGLPPTPAAAPTVGSIAADSKSKFNAATPGGYFAYAFAYGNSVGVGMVSAATAVQTVANGDSVPLTFPTAGVNPLPSFVRVYRQALPSSGSTPDVTQMQMLTDVAIPSISTAGLTWKDENDDIPGTYTCFYLNTTKDGMHIGRLGELRRFQFAPVTLAEWFASAWYGMLVCPATQWSIAIKNVGGSAVGTPINAAYQA